MMSPESRCSRAKRRTPNAKRVTLNGFNAYAFLGMANLTEKIFGFVEKGTVDRGVIIPAGSGELFQFLPLVTV